MLNICLLNQTINLHKYNHFGKIEIKFTTGKTVINTKVGISSLINKRFLFIRE